MRMIDKDNGRNRFTLAIWSITPAQRLGRVAWMSGAMAVYYAIITSSDNWIMSRWPLVLLMAVGLAGAITEGSIDRDSR